MFFKAITRRQAAALLAQDGKTIPSMKGRSNAELLLPTGAKIAIVNLRNPRVIRYYIMGYSHDGADVRPYEEIIGR